MSSSKGRITKLSKKKLTLTKDFKAGILSTKDQNYAQAFIYQYNLDAQ